MHPLRVRVEIDAFIADRLLEAVWREALWLVADGVATTAEIDDAITHGFGLRWGQMGLFDTYRVAGGDGGFRHFIEQFGPALDWPWSRLTHTPEFTPGLVDRIVERSDRQSGHHGPGELERIRDRNLAGFLQVLERHRLGGDDPGRPPPGPRRPVPRPAARASLTDRASAEAVAAELAGGTDRELGGDHEAGRDLVAGQLGPAVVP